ncbi:MAG: hypothetical protein RLZZ230_500 [Candidatus Parcubacteria bacterium]|jgi:hypothetical protein
MFFYILILFTFVFNNVYASDDCVINYIIIHDQNQRRICIASAVNSEEEYQESKMELDVTERLVQTEELLNATEENVEDVELTEEINSEFESETLLVNK